MRKTIAIPFNYDESWIGGAYYVKNLVSSFILLGDDEKPDVYLICHGESSFDFMKKATGYERLNWISPARLSENYSGPSLKTSLLARILPKPLRRKLQFDFVYPYPYSNDLKQTACWIPDFQEKYFPEFFSNEEIEVREKQHRGYFQKFDDMVFSSKTVRDDFLKFYPEANVRTHVVNFAVFERKINEKEAEATKEKHGLVQRYFYCPNQFWVHKNHKAVINAVKLLKAQGVEAVVIFSGKEHDSRAPNHTKELKEKVAASGLQDNIKFLGFLPRDEQMHIFKGAMCIIQPSLFEGWSTVIEDAKSLSKYIIASSIPSNIEQKDENMELFNPKSDEELASIMRKYIENDPPARHIDYSVRQINFAKSIMSLVSLISER